MQRSNTVPYQLPKRLVTHIGQDLWRRVVVVVCSPQLGCCLGTTLDSSTLEGKVVREALKPWHTCKLIHRARDSEQCSQTRVKTSVQNLQSFTRFSQIQLSRVLIVLRPQPDEKTAAGTSEAQEESDGRSISTSLAAAASPLLLLSIATIATLNIAKGWISETPQPFKQPTADAANSAALVAAVSLLLDLPTEPPKRRAPAPPPRRRQRSAHLRRPRPPAARVPLPPAVHFHLSFRWG